MIYFKYNLPLTYMKTSVGDILAHLSHAISLASWLSLYFCFHSYFSLLTSLFMHVFYLISLYPILLLVLFASMSLLSFSLTTSLSHPLSLSDTHTHSVAFCNSIYYSLSIILCVFMLQLDLYDVWYCMWLYDTCFWECDMCWSDMKHSAVNGPVSLHNYIRIRMAIHPFSMLSVSACEVKSQSKFSLSLKLLLKQKIM